MNYVLVLMFGLAFSALGLTVFLFIRWYLRKNKIQIHIMREYGDMLKVMHSRKISLRDNTFKYGEHAYKIEPEKAILDKNDKPILYYTQGEAQPQRFKNIENAVNSEDFKTVIEAKILNRLMKRHELDSFYIIIIVVLGVGLVGLGAFAIWQITSLSSTIAQLQQVTNPTVIH